ncbi:hypothetical protein K469DRAFT_14930 [Zopfia rhizophila CBS 207.26]|uniref:Uncharacterized protein n=1 Tax=Zopfia rhizophila CBS 207.26 TaxID=1314779 RepID=A0A6A6EXQ4_9PEZI|nr:hypothetical protein K469DRAFT_14930 [Zopfia rhizophila CBS 207.26]
MFGGHILRWSGLENSLEVALRHFENPDTTNEDCQQHHLQIILEVKSIVGLQKNDNVEIEWVGGPEGRQRVLHLCQVSQRFLDAVIANRSSTQDVIRKMKARLNS